MTSACFSRGHTGFSRNATLVATVNPPALAGGVFNFTQSGLKPLTSIKMSKEYVSLYELYVQLDAIICIGFGFNSDDAHINGIFRQLVDEEKKHLFYVTNNHNTRIIKQKLQKNIRLSSESMKDRIHIISVDSDRKCESLLWTLYVEEQINNIKSQQG